MKLLVSALAVAVATSGCVYDIWDSFDDCDSDPAGCQEGGEFIIDPNCPLTDDLQVSIGEGEFDFTPIGVDGPELHFGPQGGTHVFIALRVENPAPDYLRLRVNLLAESEVCDPPDPCQWQSAGMRQGIVLTRLEIENGRIEVPGLLFIVDISGDSRITLDVEDTCGRTGQAMATFMR